MARTLPLVLLLVLVFSTCQSRRHSPNVPASDSTRRTVDSAVNGPPRRPVTTSHSWSAADKQRFLDDCIAEAGEKRERPGLREFCNCMLEQSQRYYPGYDALEEKGKDDTDREIFFHCIDLFPGDEP